MQKEKKRFKMMDTRKNSAINSGYAVVRVVAEVGWMLPFATKGGDRFGADDSGGKHNTDDALTADRQGDGSNVVEATLDEAQEEGEGGQDPPLATLGQRVHSLALLYARSRHLYRFRRPPEDLSRGVFHHVQLGGESDDERDAQRYQYISHRRVHRLLRHVRPRRSLHVRRSGCFRYVVNAIYYKV